MDKDFALAHKDCTADAVLRRGYEIYDEWTDNGVSSRGIVGAVKCAVDSIGAERDGCSHTEALSYLFALDLRVREKYHTIFRCLCSYFSWRRETCALRDLKGILNLSDGDADVRAGIEIVLQRLREKLEDDESADGDDETHGGKRNGKSDGEAVASEEKEQEQAPDEQAEEAVDAEESKEASEEKAEEISEQASSDESIKEDGAEQRADEVASAEDEIAIPDEKDLVNQEAQGELKEENNEPEEKSEPSPDKTDKKEEFKAYNDAMDLPPLYREDELRGSAEKRSFIDEMVIDNMVKGDKSIIGYQRIDEAERNREAGIPRETAETQNEGNKGTDKDADLYDKMLAADKGDAQQTDKVEMTQETGKVEEEQPKETIQNNDNGNSTEQEFKPLSEMPQADALNVDQENNIANELNATMSTESKVAYIRMQEDMMREQVSIVLEELGMNDPVEIIGISEPDVVSPPSAMQSKK